MPLGAPIPLPIIPFDPTVASSGTFLTQLSGSGTIVLWNLSTVNLTFTFWPNAQYSLPAGSARRFKICTPAGSADWAWSNPNKAVTSANAGGGILGEAYPAPGDANLPETYQVANAGGLLNIQQIQGNVSTKLQLNNVFSFNFEQLVATGDPGTVRWTVANPTASGLWYVVDHAFVQVTYAGTFSGSLDFAGAVAVENSSSLVDEYLCGQVLNSINTQDHLPTPVYFGPNSQVYAYTQNESGYSLQINVSFSGHTVPM